MPRKKGTPKTGGRKKGTPNRLTAIGEDKLKNLIDAMEDDERFTKELNTLHGKDFFNVYLGALQYLRPKYSNIEFNGEVKVDNEVTSKMKAFLD